MISKPNCRYFVNLDEFCKLQEYLVDNGIPHERIDELKYVSYGHGEKIERHQIWVPSRAEYEWDVICHPGSYGYERGFLEIMGNIVDPECGDTVEGWLTADDVIERIERASKKKGEE